MLPEGEVWGDSIFAVVEEDNPGKRRIISPNGTADKPEGGGGCNAYIPSGFIDSPV